MKICKNQKLQTSTSKDSKAKKYSEKGELECPCANGTLRLPHCTRSSLLAEGNLEPEDAGEIEEGDKEVRKTERPWSMRGSFVYRHHEEHRLKFHDPDLATFPIPMKYVRRKEAKSNDYTQCV